AVCSLPLANPGWPGFAHVLTGRSRVNPTSTGGGLGRGVAVSSVFVATPLPVPPPQGRRERCGASLRNDHAVVAEQLRPIIAPLRVSARRRARARSGRGARR